VFFAERTEKYRVNRAPELYLVGGPKKLAREGESYSRTVAVCEDPDKEKLYIQVKNLPYGFHYTKKDGIVKIYADPVPYKLPDGRPLVDTKDSDLKK